MLLLFLKDRITPLSPNKCNIGWLGWIFPKHAPLRCLPVCQSLKLMRRQQLFVVVVTKDSPCLARSDKLPSHLSVRENSFQGWKQSPFPPRIMEQKHQPIQLQNKAPRHQKAVSLRITFTSTQTNPKASLLAQTTTGVRIFWFFFPHLENAVTLPLLKQNTVLQKQQGHSLPRGNSRSSELWCSRAWWPCSWGRECDLSAVWRGSACLFGHLWLCWLQA